MTYTFHLRKGVKFHDGTDFEAADVKATFDRIVFPPANLLSLRILPIKETVVRDRYTVEMKLSEPRDSYTFLASLAGGWNVITSKKALDQYKGDLKQVDNFPGTGPFMYKNRTTESWELVRNPNYWNPHAPYVDRIVFVWLKAWTPELAAALLGEPVKAYAYDQKALEACAKIRFRPEIALTRLQLAELLLSAAKDRGMANGKTARPEPVEGRPSSEPAGGSTSSPRTDTPPQVGGIATPDDPFSSRPNRVLITLLRLAMLLIGAKEISIYPSPGRLLLYFP
jgi:hypothetical protein